MNNKTRSNRKNKKSGNGLSVIRHIKKFKKAGPDELAFCQAKCRAFVLSRAAAGTHDDETRERLLAELREVAAWMFHNDRTEDPDVYEEESLRLHEIASDHYFASRAVAQQAAAIALFKAVLAERAGAASKEDRKVVEEDACGLIEEVNEMSNEELKADIVLGEALNMARTRPNEMTDEQREAIRRFKEEADGAPPACSCCGDPLYEGAAAYVEYRSG